jgi:hypothetical protein
MKNKTIIIYIIGCVLLYWLIITWGKYIIKGCYNIKEGLTEFEEYSKKINPYPRNAVINYNNLNSPAYSHTVDMPLNTTYGCKNFCGPQAQCAITRAQCTADIDCYGCDPGPTRTFPKEESAAEPYDDAGKLGINQSLQYSYLTTGYDGHGIDFAAAYPNSINAVIQQPYLGADVWTNSFNKGLNYYNKTRESYDKYGEGRAPDFFYDEPTGLATVAAPNYPTTISATGQFYETLPPASNSYLS